MSSLKLSYSVLWTKTNPKISTVFLAKSYWSVSKSSHSNIHCMHIRGLFGIRRQGREKYNTKSSYQAHTLSALHQEGKGGGKRRRVSGWFLLQQQLYNHGSSTNKPDLGSELSSSPIPLWLPLLLGVEKSIYKNKWAGNGGKNGAFTKVCGGWQRSLPGGSYKQKHLVHHNRRKPPLWGWISSQDSSEKV